MWILRRSRSPPKRIGSCEVNVTMPTPMHSPRYSQSVVRLKPKPLSRNELMSPAKPMKPMKSQRADRHATSQRLLLLAVDEQFREAPARSGLDALSILGVRRVQPLAREPGRDESTHEQEADADAAGRDDVVAELGRARHRDTELREVVLRHDHVKMRRQEPRTSGRAREFEVMRADGARRPGSRGASPRIPMRRAGHRVDQFVVEEDVHGLAQRV